MVYQGENTGFVVIFQKRGMFSSSNMMGYDMRVHCMAGAGVHVFCILLEANESKSDGVS